MYIQKRARCKLEHIYLALTRSRLDIVVSVNDNIRRKACHVVDIMIQSTERPLLLENVSEPLHQCRHVFDAMGRDLK